MPILRKQSLTSLIAIWLLMLAATVSAEITKEDRVKTAIIYKLTKFITWPEKKRALTLCVVGSGSINNELQKINNKFTMGRRISVTHKIASASLDKLCDLLFVHSSNDQDISLILSKLKDSPVLTISDSNQFASKGGTIELYRSGKRIKFAINRSSAEKSKLSISSQLLNLAKVID